MVMMFATTVMAVPRVKMATMVERSGPPLRDSLGSTMRSVIRFMTQREIELLTGSKQPQDQAELLCAIGVPVEVSPLGIPKVCIEEIEPELPLGYECAEEEQN
jgi:hypothetical protein